MKLEEAIQHATDVGFKTCTTKCGKEHLLLAQWLKELARYRKFVRGLLNVVATDGSDTSLSCAIKDFLEANEKFKEHEEEADVSVPLKVVLHCIAPIMKCRDATALASKHGTEDGDDPEFDELYHAVHVAQHRIMNNLVNLYKE